MSQAAPQASEDKRAEGRVGHRSHLSFRRNPRRHRYSHRDDTPADESSVDIRKLLTEEHLVYEMRIAHQQTAFSWGNFDGSAGMPVIPITHHSVCGLPCDLNAHQDAFRVPARGRAGKSNMQLEHP
ncbi:hypothetical protein AB1Y20_008450 [Prymnesium parvum]|uniref:Uncharacterized protein n=1 Tax=Prymnesium parvum TaxID=97485 RepID=A0AB34IUJ9_PRYPA